VVLAKLFRKQNCLLASLQVSVILASIRVTTPVMVSLTMCLQMIARKVSFGRMDFCKNITSVHTPMDNISCSLLTIQKLKSSLLDQTVLLRLKADSEEAGYLAAIFPLPKTPTLVVIK
jgi:hypothetical protein